MPVIYFQANSRWLPKKGVGSTPSQILTRKLVMALSGISVSAINAVDKSHMPASDARILPGHLHDWVYMINENECDILLDVQPGDIVGTRRQREIRRYRIAELIHEGVECFLTEYDDPHAGRPTYDIECRPVEGSGMCVDRDGNITHRWGCPDQAPIPPDFGPGERTIVPQYYGD